MKNFEARKQALLNVSSHLYAYIVQHVQEEMDMSKEDFDALLSQHTDITKANEDNLECYYFDYVINEMRNFSERSTLKTFREYLRQVTIEFCSSSVDEKALSSAREAIKLF